VGEAKIVVAGTGRAGTTLLMEVLTHLGLDTGFRPGTAVDPQARAGLERGIFGENAPRIVKNPGLSTKLRSIIEDGRIEIEHVIVPVRALDVAVASRVRVSDYGRKHGVRGGMVGGKTPNSQRAYLAEVFYELVWTLVEHDVPHTFLSFPRFAVDPTYTYDKLAWLLGDIDEDEFRRTLAEQVDAEMINEAPLTADEARKARRGAAYARLIALPAAKLLSLVRSRHERTG
jgi:hypothetical protein